VLHCGIEEIPVVTGEEEELCDRYAEAAGATKTNQKHETGAGPCSAFLVGERFAHERSLTAELRRAGAVVVLVNTLVLARAIQAGEALVELALAGEA
jgi:hypothetical protein